MTDQTLFFEKSLFSRLAVAIGRRLLPQSIRGYLILTLPTGRKLEIGSHDQGPAAHLRLNSWRPLWSSIRRGSVGFCESYVQGDWDSPNVARLIGFYLQNRDRLDRAARPVFFSSLFDRIWHLRRGNSLTGARRNIEAHYDLGNAFYRLWLDETMTYSAAWFGGGATSLVDAQRAKYQLVIDTLDLSPGQSLLEIGCGWGGLAQTVVSRGALTTAITLSSEQLAFAQERLVGRVDLRLEDYRKTTGTYDRIASIEMIEAVGEANWPTYFKVIEERLRPGGVAVIQAITIDERLFDRYRSSTDYIQRYIFPGGMLPTTSHMRANATMHGLTFEPIINFGEDYAKTLSIWREKFEAAWNEIAALGFDESFRRKWRLYLEYCEAGFAHRAIDVGLYRLTKQLE